MTNEKFTVPTTEKEAALQILIEALFEFGDILFKPDGQNGPSLVVNNESGTEISLTESQSDILRAAGVPVFKEGGDAPSFDGLLSATEGGAHKRFQAFRGTDSRFRGRKIPGNPRKANKERKKRNMAESIFKGGEEMKEKEDVKQRIDEAEKELRILFDDLIYEHCDNAGQYELNNLASGFNILLEYARKWQEAQESGPAMPETMGRSETTEEPILTASEKEYLSNVIKPFRGKSPITVEKFGSGYLPDKEGIIIWIYHVDNANIKDAVFFPYFEAGEMYRGMEADREYSLEELGL
jgi:hypothetical protein